MSLVSAGESVFVATQRGIFELGKKDGRVARIIRTASSDSTGISMRVIGNHLLTVTNYDVTGYQLANAASPVSPAPPTK